MDRVACGSSAVMERPDCTARGYRWFRCRECGKQYNECSGSLLNQTQYPSDVIALVVLWRLRYRLTLRDLAEMFLQRGIVFSHEAVREWEAKLAPVLADELRRCRRGKGGARDRSASVEATTNSATFSALTLPTTNPPSPASPPSRCQCARHSRSSVTETRS